VAGKKEPSSHFYMCWAQHHRNYRNSLTHTLDHPPYAGLKVLFLTGATLIEALLIKTTVLLSKKIVNRSWISKRGQLYFSPPHSSLRGTAVPKQSREANEIAAHLSGARNDRKGKVPRNDAEVLAMTKDYGILVFLIVARHKVRAEA